ncbi:hypothetical protein [Segetibacter aerophilus]|uniref:hypothetical protein n=1 Tax=Segetibacter aerophilus TaxID=670293 RepID=UPI0011BE9808|nr:hypothetical protein [Segetibacter aerophilus]
MFRNAVASLGTQPTDVTYARTVVIRVLCSGSVEVFSMERISRRPHKKGLKKITSSGVKK